jgi:hypothetical protein
VMLARDDGVSRLYISAQNGHLDVVKVLLEAGGRELVMLTRPDGASCLSIARPANQEEGCWVPQMECQNAGLSSNGAVTGIATRCTGLGTWPLSLQRQCQRRRGSSRSAEADARS